MIVTDKDKEQRKQTFLKCQLWNYRVWQESTLMKLGFQALGRVGII